MSTCSGTKGVCGSALGVQGQADTGHKAQLRPPPRPWEPQLPSASVLDAFPQV